MKQSSSAHLRSEYQTIFGFSLHRWSFRSHGGTIDVSSTSLGLSIFDPDVSSRGK